MLQFYLLYNNLRSIYKILDVPDSLIYTSIKAETKLIRQVKKMNGERHRKLLEAMIEFDQGSAERIQHFLKVWSFARLIGEMEGLDCGTQEILETAAVVHDIGIKSCLEKYGHCNGPQQEEEGPPLAKELLERLGYEKELTERVCWLVAHHHTYAHVEGMDYQILLEADYLVNSYENGHSPEQIETFCRNVFRTPSGIRLLSLQSGLALG